MITPYARSVEKIMSRLLSFDVSSISTGWSLFDDGRLKSYGLITRSIICDLSVAQRLFVFKKDVEHILLHYTPDCVVVEETYMKNVKTLKTLMQFIGVLQLACYELLDCLEPVFLSPNTVRSYFGVKGKEEAFDFVFNKYKKTLGKLDFKSGNDITDSILQGLYWLKYLKEHNNEHE
jgi:Holliday junction resolvasome RuvABC endonuclease subunit